MGHHPARAADVVHSGLRLTVALLGYFVLVTVVITLSPFDFAPRPVRISLLVKPSDVIANVALFLPIGFLLRSVLRGPSPHEAWRVVSTACVFSLVIEIAQLFIRGRFVSPVDVATNTCGAWFGLLLRDRIERSNVWNIRLVGRIGLDIPLVGLLYLLVPQLWLSGVGVVDDPRRAVTTLLLGAGGSVVLAALRRHRWQSGVRLAAQVIPPLALVWFTVGALPALAAAPWMFAPLALAVVVLTWWLLARSSGLHERRFEIDTLRHFLPVFALYVIVSALWPPFRSPVAWHGAIGFSNRLHNAGVVELLALLEQVGAFTLLGYALAEWSGRRELTLGVDVRRIAVPILTFAFALEAVQGMLAGPGASALRALLSTAGAAYGVAVYHLARTHVRTLRAASEAASGPIDAAA
jgi:glycopeptide antibiotics resistance protein